MTSPETQIKIYENQLRRAADRQGLRLTKSRTRDPKAVDYDRWALLDIVNGGCRNPTIAERWIWSWTLDQVRDYLKGGEDGQAAEARKTALSGKVEGDVRVRKDRDGSAIGKSKSKRAVGHRHKTPRQTATP
jgi:hypothetical protein